MADSALTNRSPSLTPGKNLTFTNGTFAYGTLAVTPVTGNYTALVSDDLLLCNSTTGTLAVTLYPATGNTGRRLTIRNTDTDLIVSVDGSGSETVCGALTTFLGPGQAINLVSDGTNWISLNKIISLGYIDLAGVATGDFTSLITPHFNSYRLTLLKVIPSSDQVNILLTTSTNNGSSFDTGASDYHWSGFTGFASAASVDTADAAINLNLNGNGVAANRVSNVAGEGGFNGIVDMFRPQDADYFTCVVRAMYNGATSYPGNIVGGAQRLASADVDAIRVSNSAGTNFTSGVLILEGIH